MRGKILLYLGYAGIPITYIVAQNSFTNLTEDFKNPFILLGVLICLLIIGLAQSLCLSEGRKNKNDDSKK